VKKRGKGRARTGKGARKGKPKKFNAFGVKGRETVRRVADRE